MLAQEEAITSKMQAIDDLKKAHKTKMDDLKKENDELK